MGSMRHAKYPKIIDWEKHERPGMKMHSGTSSNCRSFASSPCYPTDSEGFAVAWTLKVDKEEVAVDFFFPLWFGLRKNVRKLRITSSVRQRNARKRGTSLHAEKIKPGVSGMKPAVVHCDIIELFYSSPSPELFPVLFLLPRGARRLHRAVREREHASLQRNQKEPKPHPEARCLTVRCSRAQTPAESPATLHSSLCHGRLNTRRHASMKCENTHGRHGSNTMDTH